MRKKKKIEECGGKGNRKKEKKVSLQSYFGFACKSTTWHVYGRGC
jgi:hypothetical protein